MDRVVDLSSRKDRKHISNRLAQSEKKSIFFFFWGGGLGFWMLTFLGKVPKKHPKNVSWEKIDLQVFPHFMSNESFGFVYIDGTEPSSR